MAGNAAEWVYDYFDKEYYGASDLENPQGPEEGTTRVFRGGSYLSDKDEDLRVSTRGEAKGPLKAGKSERKGIPFIGFRLRAVHCDRRREIEQESIRSARV